MLIIQEEPSATKVAPDLPGSLVLLPGGWSYERDRRKYLLWWPEPGTMVCDTELHIGGRTYWKRLDPTIAYCRADLALEVAPDDAALQREIRRDLLLASYQVRFELIDLALRQDPERAPLLLVDLYITGLDSKVASRLAEAALKAGAHVRRRRHS